MAVDRRHHSLVKRVEFGSRVPRIPVCRCELAIRLGILAVALTVAGRAQASEPDPEDFVLLRQDVRQQMFLVRGWMDEELPVRRDTPFMFGFYGISLGTVSPGLLGQLQSRTFSARQLAAERERLDRWIELLATCRRLEPGDNPRETIGRRLSAASVGLQFLRARPGSSLARDFALEAQACARLSRQAGLLCDELELMRGDAIKSPDHGEILIETTRRFEKSKEVAGWVARVQANVEAIDRECAAIGYPVWYAWEILARAVSLRAALAAFDGKGPFEPDGLANTPVTVIERKLSGIRNLCQDVGRQCETCTKVFSEPPPGLDVRILELAWASTVPFARPDRLEIIQRLKDGNDWIKAVGMSRDLGFESLELKAPNQIQVTLRATPAFLDGVVLTYRHPSEPSPLDQLFYKVVGLLSTTPPAVELRFRTEIETAEVGWYQGMLRVRDHRQVASASGSVSIKSADLTGLVRPKGVWKKENFSADADAVRKSARRVLVKYLASFEGKVSVVHDEPSYLLLRVTNARNMVIPNEKRWESLDLNLVVVHHEGMFDIICVVDGRWAPGVRAPASLEAFRDMEPTYSKHLSDFAGVLLVRLKDELVKPTAKAAGK